MFTRSLLQSCAWKPALISLIWSTRKTNQRYLQNRITPTNFFPTLLVKPSSKPPPLPAYTTFMASPLVFSDNLFRIGNQSGLFSTGQPAQPVPPNVCMPARDSLELASHFFRCHVTRAIRHILHAYPSCVLSFSYAKCQLKYPQRDLTSIPLLEFLS